MAKIKIKKKVQEEISAPVEREEDIVEEYEAPEEVSSEDSHENDAEECDACPDGGCEDCPEEGDVIEVEEGDPITLDLPELHKFKILHLSRKEADILASIRNPIISEFNERLREALSSSEEFQAAAEARKAAVDEVRAHFSDILPEGYALTTVNLDDCKVVAEFTPDQAEKTSE